MFHPQSKGLLDLYIANPTHALIVSGNLGVGTMRAAEYIIEHMGVTNDSLLIIKPEKNSIPIDTIRTLYRLTKSSRDQNMVVVIDDADTMGGDAQNALLKLLEEPPSNVFFILTTHRFAHLLPTVVSRSVHIALKEVSTADSQEFIKGLTIADQNKVPRILFLASGRPAEMTRLAQDGGYYNERIELMSEAKKILEADTYERLIGLKPYMADREKALVVVEMLSLLVTHSLYKNINLSIVHAADAIADTIESLHRNGNTRAQLLLLNDHLG